MINDINISVVLTGLVLAGILYLVKSTISIEHRLTKLETLLKLNGKGPLS